MPDPESPRIVTMSTHIYRCVLWLCPRRCRREYGALMAQAFRDLCCDAHRRGGARAVLRSWPRAFLDVCATAAAEHLARLRAGTLRAQAAAIALLVLLIAAALGPALGPMATRAPGAAKAPVARAKAAARLPERRPAFSLAALEPGQQAIVVEAGESGATGSLLYWTDGQVVRLDGTQTAHIQLGTGSHVVIFH